MIPYRLTQLTFKCKVYGMKFEEEKRLQIHKKVHGRKPKISEYSPEFNQDRLWIEQLSQFNSFRCKDIAYSFIKSLQERRHSIV